MLGPTVDRRFARLVAMKRIVTGAISIACGLALVAMMLERGAPHPLAGVAIALLLGGGAWTLRDGLRLRRELTQG